MHMNIYIPGQTAPRFTIKDPPEVPRIGESMLFDDVDGDRANSTCLAVRGVTWHLESPTGIKTVSVFLAP